MTTTISRRPRRRFLMTREYGFVGIVIALVVSTHWGTVNMSPSVPLGLYRFVSSDGPWHYGDIVQIPAVPFGRSWPATWLPLLKPIAGLPGDAVCVHPEGLWVQDRFYGRVYQEHQGKPLPVFWGCHAVEEGEVFVASQVDKSLDGRYFAMTHVTETRRVVPLWTWR